MPHTELLVLGGGKEIASGEIVIGPFRIRHRLIRRWRITAANVPRVEQHDRHKRVGAEGSDCQDSEGDDYGYDRLTRLGERQELSNGKQNENQIEFQRELEKAGGMYIVAHSLDDVARQL